MLLCWAGFGRGFGANRTDVLQCQAGCSRRDQAKTLLLYYDDVRIILAPPPYSYEY